MSRLAGALLLLATTGCAGRWMAVPEPGSIRQPAVGPRRDYRAVLRTDSTVVLLDAVVRDDSVVELPSDQTSVQRSHPPRAIALADVVHLEQWQPGGERVAGGTALALVGGLAALLVLIALTWSNQ
ncbi:MAG TPA: hypothetical protein VEU74_07615 [Gemmatimonadales bacterium]|nr:hypothetical protein [Gemmatimonadales bacterium]